MRMIRVRVSNSPKTMPSFVNILLATLVFFLLLSFARSDTEPQQEICPSLSNGSGSISLCPVNCFRPDPVCGVNGVTYWCGCHEAACAGAQVAKRGFCQVGNGGSGTISGQAFLLVHIVWLIVLGFSVLCGFL